MGVDVRDAHRCDRPFFLLQRMQTQSPSGLIAINDDVTAPAITTSSLEEARTLLTPALLRVNGLQETWREDTDRRTNKPQMMSILLSGADWDSICVSGRMR
jgi:hypothetical protein